MFYLRKCSSRGDGFAALAAGDGVLGSARKLRRGEEDRGEIILRSDRGEFAELHVVSGAAAELVRDIGLAVRFGFQRFFDPLSANTVPPVMLRESFASMARLAELMNRLPPDIVAVPVSLGKPFIFLPA